MEISRQGEPSAEDKVRGWSAYHHLDDREWVLYTCTDCDPRNADADDPEDEANKYDVEAQIVLPRNIERPDHCPRCASYLGLQPSAVVEVRWVSNNVHDYD